MYARTIFKNMMKYPISQLMFEKQCVRNQEVWIYHTLQLAANDLEEVTVVSPLDYTAAAAGSSGSDSD